MIETITAIAILSGIFFVFSGLMPNVTELPWGLEAPLQIFMEQVNTIIQIFPPMEVVWHVLTIALTVKVAIYVFELVWRIVTLIRG